MHNLQLSALTLLHSTTAAFEMADIGASIAVSVGIELVKFIIAEVNKHKQQVELANSYLSTYALSINKTQLESN